MPRLRFQANSSSQKFTIFDFIQEDLVIPLEDILSSDEEFENEKVVEKDEKIIYKASFKDYLWKPELTRAIGEAGYVRPSKVQKTCFKQALNGGDLIVQSRTGSGKTAIYVLSTLQAITPTKEVSVLVVVHSRELAFQVVTEFHRFAKYLKEVRISAYYGGLPVYDDMKDLQSKQPNIVICTPGRLKCLFESGALKVEHLKFFIIDEVDKALALLDTRKIVQDVFLHTPKSRQVMMFATLINDDITRVAEKYTKKALKYLVKDEELTLKTITQYYVMLDEEQKKGKLAKILDNLEFNQVIIFVNTIDKVDLLYKYLHAQNFAVSRIHSSILQEERLEIMRRFKEGCTRVLVSSDLLGRGIDIEHVNVIINYDMAQKEETYMRRIGRTARFGRKGLAISFLTNYDEIEMRDKIESRFGASIPILPDSIHPDLYI